MDVGVQFINSCVNFTAPIIVFLPHASFDFHNRILEFVGKFFTFQLLILGKFLTLILRFLEFSNLRILGPILFVSKLEICFVRTLIRLFSF